MKSYYNIKAMFSEKRLKLKSVSTFIIYIIEKIPMAFNVPNISGLNRTTS